jgi:hypothetical protein
VVEASPLQNADVFNSVIGGYDGLGVITEATFELTDNVKVKRQDRTMPIAEYGQYFVDHVRASSAAVFHNADIYPNAYNMVHAVTYAQTDDPVTGADRLVPENSRTDSTVLCTGWSRSGLSGRPSDSMSSTRFSFEASP